MVGVVVGRYSFNVELLHLLLYAGLSRRSPYLVTPKWRRSAHREGSDMAMSKHRIGADRRLEDGF